MKLDFHVCSFIVIIFAAVVILSLVIPVAHTPVFWIAFCADLLMFLICAGVFVRAFRRKDTLVSKLLGWPLFRVSLIATSTQVIVGYVQMAFASWLPITMSVIIEVLLYAVTGLSMIARDASMTVVEKTEQMVVENTSAWKAIRIRVAAIAAETRNADLKRIAEEIRYSDPLPTAIDGQIAEMVESLAQNADSASINKTLALLEQRKVLAKETKIEML